MLKGTMKKQIMKGFTLVELLIVVIILAILAAIVVPQFASSTDDAKVAALDSTLSNIRSALDLYYQQHSGRYPGQYKVDGSTLTGTDAERISAFNDQLSLYTDASGQTAVTKTATIKYGPYLKKSNLPVNPVTNVATLVTIDTGALGIAGDGANGGWKYDVKTGQFIANDTTLDASSIGYDKH